jgi:hypothetical protein
MFEPQADPFQAIELLFDPTDPAVQPVGVGYRAQDNNCSSMLRSTSRGRILIALDGIDQFVRRDRTSAQDPEHEDQ